MIVEHQPAWAPHLRSRSQARTAPTRHFVDPSLAVAALEVDAIVETRDGRWAAFEIKLGSGLIDHGAASLLKFAARVDTTKVGDPALLAVISGNGYGYVRNDGVAVIPIGALGA